MTKLRRKEYSNNAARFLTIDDIINYGTDHCDSMAPDNWTIQIYDFLNERNDEINKINVMAALMYFGWWTK